MPARCSARCICRCCWQASSPAARGGSPAGLSLIHIYLGDGFADQLFDLPQIGQLRRHAEADRKAAVPGPAGAADPVDVGLGDVGQIEVDHAGPVSYTHLDVYKRQF